MRFRSLKHKLNLALFVVLILPLVGSICYFIQFHSDKIEEEARTRISSELNVASQIIVLQSGQLKELAQFYGQMAHWSVLIKLDLIGKLDERLIKEVAEKKLDEILVVDLDRRIISSSEIQTPRYRSVAGNDFVENALSGLADSGLELVSYRLEHGGEQVDLSLTGAAPLRDPYGNEIVGAIVIRRFFRSPSWVMKDLSRMLVLDLFIYARDRLVASTAGGEKALEHKVLKQPVAEALLLDGKSLNETRMSPGGYLARYQPLWGRDGKTIGILMARIRADDFVELRTKALIALVAIALTGLVLTLVIKLMLERSVLAPIRNLTKGTKDLARGNYSCELKVESRDEIGDLTVSFNRMAASLYESHAKLQGYSKSLESHKAHLEEEVARRTGELHFRVELESLLAGLSTRFIHLEPGLVEMEIDRALKVIGQFCQVDRSYVFQFEDHDRLITNTHEWCAPGIEPQIEKLQKIVLDDELPAFAPLLRARESVAVERISDIDPEAVKEKEFLLMQEVQSCVVVPMICGNLLLGFLGFDSVRSERAWTEDVILLLKMTGEIFANALRGKWGEEALRKAKEDADAANRAKSEFLAAMSHEIRTPMNAIIGMATLLSHSQLSGQERELASTIKASADSLLTIINDILDFSKIEAGKMELEVKPVDLRTCIESTLDMVAPKAHEKSLGLGYVIEPQAPAMILGDYTRLRQILTNLLGNAIKFTNTGEVMLHVKAEPLSAVSSLDWSGPREASGSQPERGSDDLVLLFSIKDTGIGISKEHLNRLFQAFSQLDPSTTRKYGGTGLGLAICRRLTELMGGEIWAESVEGEGSTFCFTVPCRTAEATPVLSQEEALEDSEFDPGLGERLPLRILIVEDNYINQQLTSLMLERLGYEADVAVNGLEALKALWLKSYDLILMDVQMPEMDGFEATKRIREGLSRQLQPHIVAMTANVMEGYREECLAAGMDDYISKPVDVKDLILALSKCYGRKESSEREGSTG